MLTDPETGRIDPAEIAIWLTWALSVALLIAGASIVMMIRGGV